MADSIEKKLQRFSKPEEVLHVDIDMFDASFVLWSVHLLILCMLHVAISFPKIKLSLYLNMLAKYLYLNIMYA